MKVTNKKKLIISLIIVIIVIVIIIVMIKFRKSNKIENNVENNIDIGENTNGSSSSNVESVPASEPSTGAQTVPQNETVYYNEYMDENKNDLSDSDAKAIRQKIIDNFKSRDMNELGINTDASNIKIVFSSGTTFIDNRGCFVFYVYVQSGNSLVNRGMFAMTQDCSVLYKFNSQTITYDVVD